MRAIPALAAALAVAGTVLPVRASPFWTFGFDDGVNSASGTLATDALGGGSHLVTGTYDTVTITGLAPIGAGFGAGSDDLLLLAPDFLDPRGLGFTLSRDGPEVPYSPEGGNFFEHDGATGLGGGFAHFAAALAVPEPVSIAMFAAGLASLGLLRRRRRQPGSSQTTSRNFRPGPRAKSSR